MQPITLLRNWLSEHASATHYLFAVQDLRILFPNASTAAYSAILSRSVRSGLLKRVCRGLFLYEKALPRDGLLLYHIAARYRANHFNYISLETVLSDAGVISQMPINWIGVLSSGRSYTLTCKDIGTIEFVHTNQKPASLKNALQYDRACGMWRASVAQALRDMKATHRNLDLIDWEVAHEFI